MRLPTFGHILLSMKLALELNPIRYPAIKKPISHNSTFDKTSTRTTRLIPGRRTAGILSQTSIRKTSSRTNKLSDSLTSDQGSQTSIRKTSSRTRPIRKKVSECPFEPRLKAVWPARNNFCEINYNSTSSQLSTMLKSAGCHFQNQSLSHSLDRSNW